MLDSLFFIGVGLLIGWFLLPAPKFVQDGWTMLMAKFKSSPPVPPGPS